MIELLKQNRELFDLFARREEYDTALCDMYGRFPYYLSKDRSILEPAVSKFLIENGLKIEYPEGKKFALCLTHDIDLVFFSRNEMIQQLISRKPQNALKMLFHWSSFKTTIHP